MANTKEQNLYLKQYTMRLREKGLCIGCRKPKDEERKNQSFCTECALKRNARKRSLKIQGLCPCGQKLDREGKFCSICLRKNRVKYLEKKEQNLCVRCSQPKPEGEDTAICSECKAKDRESNMLKKVEGFCQCGKVLDVGKSHCSFCITKVKTKYQKNKLQGLCVNCGEQNDRIDRTTCQKCFDRVKISRQNQEYKIRHNDKEKERSRTNPRVNEARRIRYRYRRKNDIQFHLSSLLRARLCKIFKRGPKVGSAVRDLGCSILELKEHLEKQFQPGMTWENHGRGDKCWNIDHILPISAVDLTDRQQFLKVCHFTNLQPLWAKDNLSKGDRVPEHLLLELR